MQKGGRHEHDVGGEKVGAGEHDHDEPDGEHEGAGCADEAGRVLLVPGGCLGG